MVIYQVVTIVRLCTLHPGADSNRCLAVCRILDANLLGEVLVGSSWARRVAGVVIEVVGSQALAAD